MTPHSYSATRVLLALPEAASSVSFVGSERLLVSGQYWSHRQEGLFGLVRLVTIDGQRLGQTRGADATAYTAVAPSGREFACTGYSSCTVHSLEGPRLPLVRRLRVGRQACDRVLYTPDGHWLVWGGRGRVNPQAKRDPVSPAPPKDDVFEPLVLWDTAQWAPRVLTATGQPVCSLAFSADRRTLLVGGWQGGFQLWDAAGWRLLDEGQSPRGQEDGKFPAVRAMQLSPDGRTLYGAFSRLPYLRSFTLPGLVPAAPFPQEYEVHALVLLPDGRTLISGDDCGDVTFWDIGTGARVGLYTAEGQRQLVTDVRTGESRTEETVATTVHALALGADGTMLAAGDSVGRVHLVNLGD